MPRRRVITVLVKVSDTSWFRAQFLYEQFGIAHYAVVGPEYHAVIDARAAAVAAIERQGSS